MLAGPARPRFISIVPASRLRTIDRCTRPIRDLRTHLNIIFAANIGTSWNDECTKRRCHGPHISIYATKVCGYLASGKQGSSNIINHK